MALLPPVAIEGTLQDPRTGESIPYVATCVVVIDSQGRESMHVRGKVGLDGGTAPIVVLGHTDTSASFVGREVEAAHDCVVAHVARTVH